MSQPSELSFDVASALGQGKRDYQEDAIVSDFPMGSGFGFAVLSDGMGGHAAGAIASKIVVTEVFSELMFQRTDTENFASDVVGALSEAAEVANESIRAHTETHPETRGMGATLVVPVFLGGRMHWLSVGDSPLFLYRGGSLRQLNEDHSLAPQIDLMVEHGLIDPETAAHHPDRNCLTSALGSHSIPRIDCPAEPLPLEDGDVVIAASDGLKFLPNARIEEVVTDLADEPSARIAARLIEELEALDDPEQDNVSIAVIRVRQQKTVTTVLPKRRWGLGNGRRKRVRAPVAAATGLIGRTLHALRQRPEPERGGVS